MKRTIILVLYLFINIALCFANEVSVWTDENGQTHSKSSYESGIVNKYQPSDVKEIFVWEDEQGQTQWSYQQPKDWEKYKDKNAQDFVTVSDDTGSEIDMLRSLKDIYDQCIYIMQSPPSNNEQCDILRKHKGDINAIVNRLHREKLAVANDTFMKDVDFFLELCSQIKPVSHKSSRSTGKTQVQIDINVPITKKHAPEFYPGVDGGAVNPKTGQFYPGTREAVVNPKTGEVYPGVPGGAINLGR